MEEVERGWMRRWRGDGGGGEGMEEVEREWRRVKR